MASAGHRIDAALPDALTPRVRARMTDGERGRVVDEPTPTSTSLTPADLKNIAQGLGQERERRVAYADHVDQHVIITAADVDAKRAIHIKASTRSAFVIESDVKCAKVFVEGCSDCTVTVKGAVLSEHVEVWECQGVRVRYDAPVGTTQVDQSRNVVLSFAERGFLGAVVFATSVDVRVGFGAETNGAEYERLDHDSLAPGDHREIPQFITRVVDGALLTERLIRGKDEYPTTERELRAALGDELTDDHLDTAPARAELRKDKGNAAFKDGIFTQAVVHYTEALELDPTHVVALCNRAQCFLKLGEHEKALSDADACIAIKHDYVKAHFRKGLALHAMRRFPHAIQAFERALAFDPANIQAKDALRLAEVQAQRAAARAP
jgi:hypothetical protein